MTLLIKNMITTPGRMTAQNILESMKLPYKQIEIGHVEIDGEITELQRSHLKIALKEGGMDLVEDRKSQLVEKIRNVVVEMVYVHEEPPRVKNSCYISQRLQYDYTYLATLFSDATGMTIEHYIIAHRIERAKKMLVHDKYSLTTIAYKLNYSSVAHLSMQFKKVTGYTPTYFKQLRFTTQEPELAIAV